MNCQNCGSSKIENYCPECGEKRFHPHSLTLRHLSEETIEGFSHFDSKFFSTLKTLLFKPAILSLEYCKGITVRFMKPIAFFLVTNLIFFVFSLWNPFSLPLYNYVTYSPFTEFHTKEIVVKKQLETSMSDEAFSREFNERIRSSSKAFIILLIPVYGIIFATLFIRKKRRFGEHLVFASHFLCFVLWLFLIQGYLVEFFGMFLTFQDNDLPLSLADLAIVSLYLTFSLKRFYAVNWLWALPSALIICILLAYATQAYRMLLFFKIIYLS